MLYLPDCAVTTEMLGRLNSVDTTIARQDIVNIDQKITRYHRITVKIQQDGSYQIKGTELNRRLCLFHWLQQSIRLCPRFIQQHFIPGLKNALKTKGIPTALYDDINLHALVNLCAHRLRRTFTSREGLFLRLFLQYCLLQHHYGCTPTLTEAQQYWVLSRPEQVAAQDIVRHWQRRVLHVLDENEPHFLTLLFMMLRIPDPVYDIHHEDIRLREAIIRLIARFRAISGMAIDDEQGLAARLYIHLNSGVESHTVWCRH